MKSMGPVNGDHKDYLERSRRASECALEFMDAYKRISSVMTVDEIKAMRSHPLLIEYNLNSWLGGFLVDDCESGRLEGSPELKSIALNFKYAKDKFNSNIMSKISKGMQPELNGLNEACGYFKIYLNSLQKNNGNGTGRI